MRGGRLALAPSLAYHIDVAGRGTRTVKNLFAGKTKKKATKKPKKAETPKRATRRTKKLVVTIGLGDGIRRLQYLDKRYSMGLDPEGALAIERELLTDALNAYPVEHEVLCFPDQMPADLDGDGAISFFEFAAATSCCRTDLSAPDTSRTKTDRSTKLLKRRA